MTSVRWDGLGPKCSIAPPGSDRVARAADPGRRKLLDLLHADDGRTLSELCEHLDMTRQGVTQHLDLLEAANLVATVRRGREKLTGGRCERLASAH